MPDNTLVTLPGEIRNQIYRLLLTVPSPGTPRPLGSNPAIYPQLLSVCRQIHQEAVDILYGENTFIAHNSLLASLPQLRRRQRSITSAYLIARIRRYHVYIRLDCDPGFTAEKARDAFTNIEELTVEVYQSQFGGSGRAVLRLLEEIRGVHRAKVFGSVSAFPEYTCWLEKAMMTPKGISIAEYGTDDEETFRDLWTDGGR